MIVVHQLAKVATTPSLSARSLTTSSGYAVTRIVGIAYPVSTRCLCSSTPVIPGMWTSVTKQAVWAREGDTRKSAADGKASQQSSAGAPKQWLMFSAIRLGNGPLHVDTDWG